ncbi:hypothetical protein D9615_010557 [Tricholomella constricta]|uniref:Secreted protein n=1 Tax=Tricholomella constricta TaxID=117010 RepID=A0A8H5H5H5_9AGAR|nr:hypothetical protein D9615_010557 [Tricholomella constricta]
MGYLLAFCTATVLRIVSCWKELAVHSALGDLKLELMYVRSAYAVDPTGDFPSSGPGHLMVQIAIPRPSKTV